MTHSSVPIPELRCDSKRVSQEQGSVSEPIVEQDMSLDDSLLSGFLTIMVAEQSRSTPTCGDSSPCIKAASDVDVSEAGIPTFQGDDEEEIWIPKGSPNRPNAGPTRPTPPAQPNSK